MLGDSLSASAQVCLSIASHGYAIFFVEQEKTNTQNTAESQGMRASQALLLLQKATLLSERLEDDQ